MTREAIPIEDLTPEEIAMIAAAEIDADMVEIYADLMDVDVPIEDLTIHRGTGCLWTDLGYPNPAEMNVKAGLAHVISDVMRERGWSSRAAARRTDIDVDVIEHAIQGRLSKVSAGNLFEVITQLGCDIGISVGTPGEERGDVLFWRADDDE